MISVIVVGDTPVRHSGKRYLRGDTFQAAAAHARQLVERGHCQYVVAPAPAAAPAPATEASELDREQLAQQVAAALDVALPALEQPQLTQQVAAALDVALPALEQQQQEQKPAPPRPDVSKPAAAPRRRGS